MKVRLILGDNRNELPKLKPNSIDSCVTDPPYGLKFMGKKWDYDVPSVELWKQVFRVMKPGAYLLSFGGTRTYHRMVCNIEDAGFEIRDQIQWLYGSGFPKSLDISKAIDKAAGAKRKVIGSNPSWRESKRNYKKEEFQVRGEGAKNITVPTSQNAKQWQGFGTALKPANEPIVLARKPLSEKTVAANVLKWGTGGLNIDGCRIEAVERPRREKSSDYGQDKSEIFKKGSSWATGVTNQGRFPANLILDEQAAEMLDRQSGISKSTQGKKAGGDTFHGAKYIGKERVTRGDSGGASRFFYCAKASKSERNAGLEGMPEIIRTDADGLKMSDPRMKNKQNRTGNQNHHPTVKPLKLMTYLCKLITPPKGLILDPFMGTGTTGLACNGFRFIGIECEKEYFKICNRRLKHS